MSQPLPLPAPGPRRTLPEEAIPLALLLITLLALLLRLFRLGESSFWIDEMLTIGQGRVPGTTLFEQFLDDAQNPLPMLLVTWMSRVADHEAWLRLPGALLGAATPALLYAAGVKVVGRRPALFAALLLALHPLHIYHSQEVRGYPYLLFFGLAATALAVRTVGRPGLGRLLLLALTGTAAVLSNLQGLFWMGGLALGMMVAGRVRRVDLPRWAAAFALILLLSSPWWSASLRVHESERLLPGEETGAPLRGETTFSAWSIPYAGFVLSMGSQLGPDTQELHGRIAQGGADALRLPRRHWPAAGAAAVVVLLLIGAGLGRAGRRSRELLAWALLPVVFAVLLALRNVKPFNPRYVIAALPSLLLLVGAGLHGLPRRFALTLLSLWLLLTGVALQRHYFDPGYRHEDVRGAAQLVEAREGGGDVVLAPSVYRVFGYYYGGTNPVHNFFAPRVPDRAAVRETLRALEPDRRYLWYVRARPWHDDPRGDLLATLEGDYRRTALFRLRGVEVLLYDRSAVPPVPGGGD